MNYTNDQKEFWKRVRELKSPTLESLLVETIAEGEHKEGIIVLEKKDMVALIQTQAVCWGCPDCYVNGQAGYFVDYIAPSLNLEGKSVVFLDCFNIPEEIEIKDGCVKNILNAKKKLKDEFGVKEVLYGSQMIKDYD